MCVRGISKQTDLCSTKITFDIKYFYGFFKKEVGNIPILNALSNKTI